MKKILGIDVSKKKLDIVLLVNGKAAHKVVDNTLSGFIKINDWIKQCDSVHVCLEATGIYGEAVASFLYKHGHIVSVVNPMRIKNFGKSKMLRSKTDAVDALLIARFCESNDLNLGSLYLETKKTYRNCLGARKLC